MKEWIAFGYADKASWPKLAREGLDVAAAGERPRSPIKLRSPSEARPGGGKRVR